MQSKLEIFVLRIQLNNFLHVRLDNTLQNILYISPAFSIKEQGAFSFDTMCLCSIYWGKSDIYLEMVYCWKHQCHLEYEGNSSS